MSEEVGPYRGSVGKGVGLGVAWNGVGLLVGAVTIFIVVGAFILAGFGLVQVAWLGPIYLRYKNQGETETAKGILIAGGISFLLSAACWGLILTAFRQQR